LPRLTSMRCKICTSKSLVKTAANFLNFDDLR
jgi:hypothetical protein